MCTPDGHAIATSRGCTHKNYASLDKNEKSYMFFFLKLLPIKVLQKFCMYSQEPKQEWTEPMRELKPTGNLPTTYQNPPPLPIFSNSFFINIDPGRIKFVMRMPPPHGFGYVVAQRHNLCMQLRSQNCEFAASGNENCLAANKNHHQI